MDQVIRKNCRNDPAFLARMIDKCFPTPQAEKTADGSAVKLQVIVPTSLNLQYGPILKNGQLDANEETRIVTVDVAAAEAKKEELEEEGVEPAE